MIFFYKSKVNIFNMKSIVLSAYVVFEFSSNPRMFRNDNVYKKNAYHFFATKNYLLVHMSTNSRPELIHDALDMLNPFVLSDVIIRDTFEYHYHFVT